MSDPPAQLPMWIAVDCACVKPAASRPRDSMPLQEINLLYLAEIVDGLVSACDILAARSDALELQILELLGLFDQPLSQEERIQRIRKIREQMS